MSVFNWSTAAQQWMSDLGEFSPTVHVERREVKGWTFDHEEAAVVKTYLTSAELRDLARACVEVADWLDRRAVQGEGTQQPAATEGE